MTTTLAARPVSDKQRSLITKLLAERNTEGTAYEGWTPDWSKATSKAASGVISYLLTLPRAVAPVEDPAVGLYWIHSDHLVRVYHGQKSGRSLAKRVHIERDGDQVDVSYEYLGQAARVLIPAATPVRLTAAEVSDIGKATLHVVDGKVTGTCLHCGRKLDDPESVDRGIGPICAAEY
jgi:hypothetical protein